MKDIIFFKILHVGSVATAGVLAICLTACSASSNGTASVTSSEAVDSEAVSSSQIAAASSEVAALETESSSAVSSENEEITYSCKEFILEYPSNWQQTNSEDWPLTLGYWDGTNKESSIGVSVHDGNAKTEAEWKQSSNERGADIATAVEVLPMTETTVAGYSAYCISTRTPENPDRYDETYYIDLGNGKYCEAIVAINHGEEFYEQAVQIINTLVFQ